MLVAQRVRPLPVPPMRWPAARSNRQLARDTDTAGAGRARTRLLRCAVSRRNGHGGGPSLGSLPEPWAARRWRSAAAIHRFSGRLTCGFRLPHDEQDEQDEPDEPAQEQESRHHAAVWPPFEACVWTKDGTNSPHGAPRTAQTPSAGLSSRRGLVEKTVTIAQWRPSRRPRTPIHATPPSYKGIRRADWLDPSKVKHPRETCFPYVRPPPDTQQALASSCAALIITDSLDGWRVSIHRQRYVLAPRLNFFNSYI
ncbi:uncharacterized protein BDZ99DRAFT_526294 [Mytilinidion resinicola]|uniref:Uncharacterized protein n=1 Tax=Mytilinidion resinicola TaxID=574789 RepID=A0A6A6Y6K1_9PEZI|nr:uncharacterized protein BDZ99DRAFT_526294 [Mytilinidion resinicola]KAF2803825.1 hypothetical protein BDZ99DRAFT_526294 [Mytilinidion resinicola]